MDPLKPRCSVLTHHHRLLVCFIFTEVRRLSSPEHTAGCEIAQGDLTCSGQWAMMLGVNSKLDHSLHKPASDFAEYILFLEDFDVNF